MEMHFPICIFEFRSQQPIHFDLSESDFDGHFDCVGWSSVNLSGMLGIHTLSHLGFQNNVDFVVTPGYFLETSMKVAFPRIRIFLKQQPSQQLREEVSRALQALIFHTSSKLNEKNDQLDLPEFGPEVSTNDVSELRALADRILSEVGSAKIKSPVSVSVGGQPVAQISGGFRQLSMQTTRADEFFEFEGCIHGLDKDSRSIKVRSHSADVGRFSYLQEHFKELSRALHEGSVLRFEICRSWDDRGTLSERIISFNQEAGLSFSL